MGKKYIQLSKEQAQVHHLYGIKGWFLVFVCYLVITLITSLAMLLKTPGPSSTINGQLITIGVNIFLLLILRFKPDYFRNTVLMVFLLEGISRLVLMVSVIQSQYVNISFFHLLTTLIPFLWATYIFKSHRVLVTTRHMILDDMTPIKSASEFKKTSFDWHRQLAFISAIIIIPTFLYMASDFDALRDKLGFSNQEEEYKRTRIQHYYAVKYAAKSLNRPDLSSLDDHFDAIADKIIERYRGVTYIDEIKYDHEVAKIYLSNDYRIKQDIINVAKVTSNVIFYQTDSQKKVTDWFLDNFEHLILSGIYPDALEKANPETIEEFNRLEMLYCILGKYNYCS